MGHHMESQGPKPETSRHGGSPPHDEGDQVGDAYSPLKLEAHPETVRKLRKTETGDLITVHLMPQNLCNQRCSFCSYRLPDNKNSSDFNEQAHLDWHAMMSLLEDFHEMGVKGIEITGGGEPLAYPFITRLLGQLGEMNFQVGLVTNGTLYERLKPGYLHRLLGPRLSWVRVSIDAATSSTYAKMRQATITQFTRAWQAVEDIATYRAEFHPDFKLGVSFVLCNENIGEVYEFVKMAKESGADNVRLSSTFSDQHMDYFRDKEAVDRAVEDSILAKDHFQHFNPSNFHVHNFIPTRLTETDDPYQPYRRCPTKDLLCVVEGSGKVYTCCTFTGSLSGLYGNFTESPGGFKGLWEDHVEYRKKWDSRKECQVSCLYRERNIAMNALIDGHHRQPNPEGIIHGEFI